MSIRTKWSSNYTYILAAIGCAAGLGNFWRFPILAYEYGGATFIVALVLANIFLAYPLVVIESIIGQKYQATAPTAFNKIKSGSSWIQWMAVFTVVGIIAYYVPIMAWAIKYFFLSFSGSFLAEPAGYFTSEILHLTDGITTRGDFQWGIFGSLLLGYSFVLYALRRGVHSLSSVIKVTATVPFIFIIIMIIRGVTLPGAGEGLRNFIIPNWSMLSDIKLWQAAITQAFFSASVALAYFTYAASHREETSELPATSLYILLGNFAVSMLSGVAVFSTLGFMAQAQGVAFSEAAKGGPMLVFSVFPQAIAEMPFGQVFFAALLFITIISLAIDSVFGLIELTIGSFTDLKKKADNFKATVVGCFIFMILSIPFMFGAGLYYLDITDHFIVSYMPLMIGALELLFVIKYIGAKKVISWINATSSSIKVPLWFRHVFYVIPVILLVLFGINLKDEFNNLYEGYPMEYITMFGFMPLAAILLLSIIYGVKTAKSHK